MRLVLNLPTKALSFSLREQIKVSGTSGQGILVFVDLRHGMATHMQRECKGVVAPYKRIDK